MPFLIASETDWLTIPVARNLVTLVTVPAVPPIAFALSISFGIVIGISFHKA